MLGSQQMFASRSTTKLPLIERLAEAFSAGTEVGNAVSEPLIINCSSSTLNAAETTLLAEYLNAYGAVLLRNAGARDAKAFQEIVDAVSDGQRAQYREPQSPRTNVIENIFTSTEHPASQRIHLHNENSHCSTFPKRIFFYCSVAPQRKGATPIASNRELGASLSGATIDCFREKGIRYKRTFGFGFGFSWQQVFGTSSKLEVESYCYRNEIGFAWVDDEKLRIWYDRPAFVVHPDNGEEVWCNNVAHYHPSTLEPRLHKMYKMLLHEDDMPFNVSFGDNSVIPDEMIADIHSSSASALRRFDWRHGDILMLDNILFAHGREPFVGDRLILVTMTDTVSRARNADLSAPAIVTSFDIGASSAR